MQHGLVCSPAHQPVVPPLPRVTESIETQVVQYHFPTAHAQLHTVIRMQVNGSDLPMAPATWQSRPASAGYANVSAQAGFHSLLPSSFAAHQPSPMALASPRDARATSTFLFPPRPSCSASAPPSPVSSPPSPSASAISSSSSPSVSPTPSPSSASGEGTAHDAQRMQQQLHQLQAQQFQMQGLHQLQQYQQQAQSFFPSLPLQAPAFSSQAVPRTCAAPFHMSQNMNLVVDSTLPSQLRPLPNHHATLNLSLPAPPPVAPQARSPLIHQSVQFTVPSVGAPSLTISAMEVPQPDLPAGSAGGEQPLLGAPTVTTATTAVIHPNPNFTADLEATTALLQSIHAQAHLQMVARMGQLATAQAQALLGPNHPRYFAVTTPGMAALHPFGPSQATAFPAAYPMHEYQSQTYTPISFAESQLAAHQIRDELLRRLQYESFMRQAFESAPTGPPPASSEALSSLATHQLSVKGAEELKEIACVICQDEMRCGQEVATMPCNHTHHQACLLPWLQLHNSCPVCRAPLQPPSPPSPSDSESMDSVMELSPCS